MSTKKEIRTLEQRRTVNFQENFIISNSGCTSTGIEPKLFTISFKIFEDSI